MNSTAALAPVISTDGLFLAVLPGSFFISGTLTNLPASKVTLTQNSTNYVSLNTSSGVLQVNQTGFASSGAYPIATVVTGVSSILSMTDSRPDLFLAGGGTTNTIASGTAALGTSAIGSGAAATTVTVAATGVLTTDTVMADFNADPTGVTGYTPSASGMLTIIKFPTANNVNFIVVNNTGGSITPGAITLNWRVVR